MSDQFCAKTIFLSRRGIVKTPALPNRNGRSSGFAIFLLLFLLAAPVLAAKIEGVTFADNATVDGENLPLQGTALLRHLVFIRAYVGAFYLKNGIPAEKVLAGSVKRKLVLHYFHNIKAEAFAKATTVMIQKNTSAETFTALQPKIDKLNNLYRDIQAGDRYQAIYNPGIGTSLALNGKPLGVIPGSDFSAAFFSIWIGENPIDKDFRDRLLGIK